MTGGVFAPNPGTFTLDGDSGLDLPHLTLTGGASMDVDGQLRIAASEDAELTVSGAAQLASASSVIADGDRHRYRLAVD